MSAARRSATSPAKQFLGLDERYLHVAVGVAVEHKLAGNLLGQLAERCNILGRKIIENKFGKLGLVHLLYGVFVCAKELVEFADEALELGDELDEAFGDKDDTEVVAVGSTRFHDAGNVFNNLVEAHIVCLNFLADKADVGLGLQGALEGDVAGATAHELDEVPIFLGRVAVALYVADNL